MTAPTTWSLVDHGCRVCGSRILFGQNVYRCSGCGATAVDRPDDICFCGLTVIASPTKESRSLFRCIPNPHRSASNPAEIVVLCSDAPT